MDSPPASPAPVPEAIERARTFARPALEQSVGRLHPDLARVCGYYFGWCDAEGTPTHGRGSRSLQACMVMLAAEASGEDPHVALPGAVAVELLHNFTLLHDDIIDGDTIRRGRPAAWVTFGTGTSLLAADALWAAAFSALIEVPGTAGRATASALNTSMGVIINAVAGEAVFDRTPAAEVDVDAYLAICETKGGELLGTAATVGTLLAGGPAAQARSLREAARHAGAAWQATNDLENIWGNAALVGKPGFQDLRQRKHTLPVIAALQSGHPAARALRGLLEKEELDEADLTRAADLIEESGGRAFTEQIAQGRLARALGTLADMRLPDPAHRNLADLLDFTVTRRPRTPSGKK
ncbi:polyprenyl synthetase family protein [Streptomyces boncukensis]|uniref:Polyprenyl synthetase family protein n=1 Tax=Streptomyces boncukensis TaxID=2711219 RepID=A0A6G4WTY0_9ACTN|nr:polyprenyl synthetase family protein [Streptomyces boncukensis]NGO68739.1 polyprenyl synthetase family protein [Streptomyces boncukensis]